MSAMVVHPNPIVTAMHWQPVEGHVEVGGTAMHRQPAEGQVEVGRLEAFSKAGCHYVQTPLSPDPDGVRLGYHSSYELLALVRLPSILSVHWSLHSTSLSPEPSLI